MSNFKSDNDQPSDKQIIIEYKKTKNLQLLGQLYERYIHLVYGVALKYLKQKEDAQDVTMFIFEELIDKVQRFEIDNFNSWLHVLTKNYCLMKIRSNHKKYEVNIAGDFMEYSLSSHPTDAHVELENDLTKLESCIEQLKDQQKVCVKLFYLQKKSYKRIEQQTKLPLKKIKSYIQNGKRNLKICIESSE